MKKRINENKKVTLTLGQLRKLVKESGRDKIQLTANITVTGNSFDDLVESLKTVMKEISVSSSWRWKKEFNYWDPENEGDVDLDLYASNEKGKGNSNVVSEVNIKRV